MPAKKAPAKTPAKASAKAAKKSVLGLIKSALTPAPSPALVAPKPLLARPKAKLGTVRLAIIGTGGMANHHAKQFSTIPGCTIVAALDIDHARAQKFATTHNIPAVYTDLATLLAESGCNAVTIVTPDSSHAALSIQCLQAGKHVLCEKPLALNAADARRMVAAAEKAGVINMVNLSYRGWPAIQAAAAIVQSGRIGEVRHVEANYLQSWLSSKVWGDWRTTPAWLWRLSRKHGSHGVLGDVGVHIVDFASFPAGPISKVYCQLKAFAKAPGDQIGEYVLDANDSAVMNVEFASGALGTIHTTRWSSGHTNRLFLKISCTLGAIEIDSDKGTNVFRLCDGPNLDKARWRTVKAPKSLSNYERFIRSVRTGINDQPDFSRGAQVQAVLDACLVSAEKDRPVAVR